MIGLLLLNAVVLCSNWSLYENPRFWRIFGVFRVFPKNMFILSVGRSVWKIEVLEMAKNAVYKGLAEATS